GANRMEIVLTPEARARRLPHQSKQRLLLHVRYRALLQAVLAPVCVAPEQPAGASTNRRRSRQAREERGSVHGHALRIPWTKRPASSVSLAKLAASPTNLAWSDGGGNLPRVD